MVNSFIAYSILDNFKINRLTLNDQENANESEVKILRTKIID